MVKKVNDYRKAQNSRNLIEPYEKGAYEAQNILDIKFSKKGKRFYLIKWKGYTEQDNTWQPLENLTNILSDVYEFQYLNQKRIKKIQKRRCANTRKICKKQNLCNGLGQNIDDYGDFRPENRQSQQRQESQTQKKQKNTIKKRCSNTNIQRIKKQLIKKQKTRFSPRFQNQQVQSGINEQSLAKLFEGNLVPDQLSQMVLSQQQKLSWQIEYNQVNLQNDQSLQNEKFFVQNSKDEFLQVNQMDLNHNQKQTEKDNEPISEIKSLEQSFNNMKCYQRSKSDEKRLFESEDLLKTTQPNIRNQKRFHKRQQTSPNYPAQKSTTKYIYRPTKKYPFDNDRPSNSFYLFNQSNQKTFGHDQESKRQKNQLKNIILEDWQEAEYSDYLRCQNAPKTKYNYTKDIQVQDMSMYLQSAENQQQRPRSNASIKNKTQSELGVEQQKVNNQEQIESLKHSHIKKWSSNCDSKSQALQKMNSQPLNQKKTTGTILSSENKRQNEKQQNKLYQRSRATEEFKILRDVTLNFLSSQDFQNSPNLPKISRIIRHLIIESSIILEIQFISNRFKIEKKYAYYETLKEFYPRKLLSYLQLNGRVDF